MKRHQPISPVFPYTFFFFNDTATTEIYTLSLHDALPILIKPAGGARRDRTDDLMLAKHALSQLSYGPVPEDDCICCARLRWSYGAAAFFERACRVEARARRLVGLGRLELPTSRLSSARSNQLSYKP